MKTADEIEIMRRAGRLVSQTLDMIGENIEVGMCTGDIDRMTEEFITSHGAIPAFKDYRGFPASTCISVDDEVVHGIPGKRKLEKGQIVSVDVGVIIDGFYGDSARTFKVGEIEPSKQLLLDVTQKSLQAGIDKAKKGNRLGAVSAAVQHVAEKGGYGVVRQLVGHGIGRDMHEDPQVPNFGSENDGPVIECGMVIAIEPMINMGTHEVHTLPDGWTVVTADGQPSAHFEHMVAVTESGPDVLTLS